MDLFELFVKLGIDDTNFSKQISDIGSKISSFGSTAINGMTAVVSAVKNVGSAIIDNVGNLAQYGDGIDKASQKMGISIEAYQEWEAVLQHSGTSMSAMTGSFKTLQNAIAGPSDEQVMALKNLGIGTEIYAMKTEDAFDLVVSKLQEMPEEARRTAIAQKLLGKGAMEMGALFNTSAEDTQAMKDRVHELGGVMSDEAVKSSALFQDNLQDMQTAISGIGRGLTEEFLPSLSLLMEGFTSLIINEEGAEEKLTEGFNEFVDGIGNITNKLQPIMEQLIPRLVDFVVESLPLLGELALTIINTLASAIFRNLNRLVKAGINLIENIIKGITDNLPLVISAALSIISQLGETLTSNIGDIIEMGLELIEGIISGIVNNLPLLVDTAVKITTKLIDEVLTHIPEILQLAADVITNLADGLTTEENLNKIIKSAGDLIEKLLSTIGNNLPKIFDKGLEIVGKIVSAIIQDIPNVGNAILNLAGEIKTKITEYDWLSLGKNVIDGIRDGITKFASNVVDSAKQVGQDIVDGFTEFFDINSPSKVMRDKIGKFLPLGIAAGIIAESSKVTDAIHLLTDEASEPIDIKPNVDVDVSKFKEIPETITALTDITKKAAGLNIISQIPKIPDVDTLAKMAESTKKAVKSEDISQVADVLSRFNGIPDITKKIFEVSTKNKIDKLQTSKEKTSTQKDRQIIININGIQFQNLDELADAIAYTMETKTRRAAAGYAV